MYTVKKYTPLGIITLLVLTFPEHTSKKSYLGCTCVSSHSRCNNKELKELEVRKKINVKI